MIKTLLFLTALGLVQGLKEPHPDCPPWGHHLLPHEYDCTKFYYCEGGEKFINPRDCAPGTEFSATLQVCIHPALADCNLPGYSTEGTTEEASTTTEATTPSTTEATTTTTQAPTTIETTTTTTAAPTTTEPTTTTTAAPSTTEATTTTTAAPSTTQASTTTEAASSTTQAASSTTLAPSSTTQAGSSTLGLTDSCELLDNGCPVDFNIHHLLPHETSCRKFYYCVFGEKVLSSCGRGSVFNPETQNCDHPGSIDRTCEEEDSSEEETSEEKESEEIELLPNGCPANFDISMYLPHEHYCNKYYQCIFGNKVDRYCGPGTHFSFELQTCDHIANVNCQLPGGDATQVVTNPPTTTTTSRPQIDFGDNGCPIDGSINWLLPHEDDCNKFYYCVWGGKLEAVCPGNLHFNAQTQACDNPATAGCLPCSGGSGCNGCNNDSEECTGTPDDNVTEPETTPAPETSTTAAPTTTTAAPTTTTAAPTTTTAAPTTTTAAPTTTTAAPTTTTAAPTTTTAAPTTTTAAPSTTTAAPTETTAAPIETTAAPTITTAAPTETTAAPTETTAAPTTTTAAPTDTTAAPTTAAPIVTTPDESSEEDLPINDDDAGDDCVDVPGNDSQENKKCEEECNVLPWAHDDCDKYWTCEGQKAVLIVCAEGLHFNPSTRTCDFACNAGCVRENVQATASYDGLKLFLPWNKIDENTKNLLKLVAY